MFFSPIVKMFSYIAVKTAFFLQVSKEISNIIISTISIILTAVDIKKF